MPQPAQASALLAHFVSLFSVPCREPNAQNMSNTALAVAGLGVPHVAQEVQSIASRVVSSPDANSQNLCNLAWSMALLNMLDLKDFDLILDMLKVRLINVVTTDGLRQLHQAHCHLEPLSKNSGEHAAWICAKDKLGNSVGHAPTGKAPSGSDILHAILESLGVRHRRHLQLSPHVVEAGLERTDDKNAPAVLVSLHLNASTWSMLPAGELHMHHAFREKLHWMHRCKVCLRFVLRFLCCVNSAQ